MKICVEHHALLSALTLQQTEVSQQLLTDKVLSCSTSTPTGLPPDSIFSLN